MGQRAAGLTTPARLRVELERVREELQGVKAEWDRTVTSADGWISAASQSLSILEALLCTPIGFGFLDLELRYVHVSERLAVMNGLPAGEHVGRTLGELFPTLMQVLGPHINGVFEDGQSRIGLEFSGPSPTRQMRSGRWIVCIYPVRSQARIIGVGSVVIDVSDGPESGALGLKNLPSMQSMFNVPARAAGGNAPLAGGDTRPRSAEPGTKDAVSTLPPSLARVAAGVARGLVDKEIARELSIPLPTVRTYVRRIYRRLGVTNRVSLALCWTAADGGTRREGRS